MFGGFCLPGLGYNQATSECYLLVKLCFHNLQARTWNLEFGNVLADVCRRDVLTVQGRARTTTSESSFWRCKKLLR